MRTRGGDVKICAGFEARILPKSAYSTERLTKIYGSPDGGYRNSYAIPTLDPAPAAFDAPMRKTTCDSQGNFEFTNLPDGDYFVGSTVTWSAPGQYGLSQQGGWIMLPVSLKGGETKSIVLTN